MLEAEKLHGHLIGQQGSRRLGRSHGDPDGRLAEGVDVARVVADEEDFGDVPPTPQPLHRGALVDGDGRTHLEHHPPEA